MRAKSVDFDVTYIDLTQKPDWFLALSPHGKVPVLSVNGRRLFESNAICEYLDEVVTPRLHPEDPFLRAIHRAWTDFVPDFAKAMSGIYYTKSAAAVAEGQKAAVKPMARLEEALAEQDRGDGPYFSGDRLNLVDAAYAPFFHRFAIAEEKLQTGLLDSFPTVQAWSAALLANDIVQGSVVADFRDIFIASLIRREFYVGGLFQAAAAAE